MGRPKGVKNKSKTVELPAERYYAGYFIMDSGLKIDFDISEDDGGDEFKELFDAKFVFDDKNTIWLGEISEDFIRAKKVVGFYIYDYEE